MSLRGGAPPSATMVARGPFLAGGVVILDDDEAHHLRVRRLGEGSVIRLVDGRGAVATARISIEERMVSARVMATTMIGAPPLTELILGAGDRDRFLSAVEKATELGATRIVPVLAERVAGVATRFQSAHVEKAEARAREAVKQCGATWTPAVGAPVSLGEAQPPSSAPATPSAPQAIARAQGPRAAPPRRTPGVRRCRRSMRGSPRGVMRSYSSLSSLAHAPPRPPRQPTK